MCRSAGSRIICALAPSFLCRDCRSCYSIVTSQTHPCDIFCLEYEGTKSYNGGRMKICKFLLLCLALLLTACGRFEVSIEPIYSPTATGIVQAPVSTATAILLPTEQVN